MDPDPDTDLVNLDSKHWYFTIFLVFKSFYLWGTGGMAGGLADLREVHTWRPPAQSEDDNRARLPTSRRDHLEWRNTWSYGETGHSKESQRKVRDTSSSYFPFYQGWQVYVNRTYPQFHSRPKIPTSCHKLTQKQSHVLIVWEQRLCLVLFEILFEIQYKGESSRAWRRVRITNWQCKRTVEGKYIYT